MHTWKRCDDWKLSSQLKAWDGSFDSGVELLENICSVIRPVASWFSKRFGPGKYWMTQWTHEILKTNLQTKHHYSVFCKTDNSLDVILAIMYALIIWYHPISSRIVRQTETCDIPMGLPAASLSQFNYSTLGKIDIPKCRMQRNISGKKNECTSRDSYEFQ